MKNLFINFHNYTPTSIIINYDNNETTHQEEYPLSLFEKFIKENEYLNWTVTGINQNQNLTERKGKFTMEYFLLNEVTDKILIAFLKSKSSQNKSS